MAARRRPRRRSTAWRSATPPTCPAAACRPGSGAASRWRGCSWRPAPLWLLDEPTTALDAASQGVLAGMMRDHLAAGGLIVAATHGSLGLDALRELRLERR